LDLKEGTAMHQNDPTTTLLYVDLFISVDGYAGGENLPPYFGYSGPDLQEWIKTEKSVDEIVVMGRRTYDAFAALPEELWREDHDALMGRRKVIFSRTLTRASWPNTEVRADALQEIERLKRDERCRLRTWGSMSLASQLLAHGRVDRLRLMRFPLVAGEAGRQPAFAAAHARELELVGVQVLDKRIVLEEYRPTARDIPRL
jgi:dihydrofolate reductase